MDRHDSAPRDRHIPPARVNPGNPPHHVANFDDAADTGSHERILHRFVLPSMGSGGRVHTAWNSSSNGERIRMVLCRSGVCDALEPSLEESDFDRFEGLGTAELELRVQA
ncbi:hypothetical protein SAMN04489712_1179 [Thermomonospora echinospora]|uniref:Uncharacterized protein n=1 Tax=Thermomonospora echinospora TaxID=1992 RepID=A0A1H6DH39_9ACTN|nr:hypothetical protein SAMN04489712_1179 [Thermomonospora echinospora]